MVLIACYLTETTILLQTLKAEDTVKHSFSIALYQLKKR